jgi:glutaredoxin
MFVTLYSRPGCHLCEDLKVTLAALADDTPFVLEERNIEEDPAAFERYRYLIPVLDIENGSLLYPPHEWETLAGALRAAEKNHHE